MLEEEVVCLWLPGCLETETALASTWDGCIDRKKLAWVQVLKIQGVRMFVD